MKDNIVSKFARLNGFAKNLGLTALSLGVICGGIAFVNAFTEPSVPPASWTENPKKFEPVLEVSAQQANSGLRGALTNCAALTEGGHDDWRLPTSEELAYAIGAFNLTDTVYHWTTTLYDPYGGVYGLIQPNNLATAAMNNASMNKYRCVR